MCLICGEKSGMQNIDWVPPDVSTHQCVCDIISSFVSNAFCVGWPKGKI